MIRKLLTLLVFLLCSVVNAGIQMNLNVDEQHIVFNSTFKIEIRLKCTDIEGCFLDNRVLERLTKEIPIHFTNLEDASINKGILVTNQYYPMGSSLFFLCESCWLACLKEINLSQLDLPPGKYELRVTIPGYVPPRNINTKEFKSKEIRLYTENIVGRTEIEIRDKM